MLKYPRVLAGLYGFVGLGFLKGDRYGFLKRVLCRFYKRFGAVGFRD